MALRDRSADLLASMRGELRSGEKLLWTGHPDPRVTRRRMRFLFFIAVPWIAVALLQPFGGTVRLFATLAGIGLLLGPFAAAFQVARTIYGLTPTRALVVTKWGRKHGLVSVDLGIDPGDVEELPIEGTAGAVLFVPGLPRRVSGTDHTGKFGFWDVPDTGAVAREVSEAIRQNAARGR